MTLLHAISPEDVIRSFTQNSAKLAKCLHGIVQKILQCFATSYTNVNANTNLTLT